MSIMQIRRAQAAAQARSGNRTQLHKLTLMKRDADVGKRVPTVHGCMNYTEEATHSRSRKKVGIGAESLPMVE